MPSADLLYGLEGVETGLLAVLAPVVLLLIFDRMGRPVVAGTWKMIAATMYFVVAGYMRTGIGSEYGTRMAYSFIGCWFGDLFLISNGKLPFLAGLVSFLLGHIGFVWAFLALLEGHADPALPAHPSLPGLPMETVYLIIVSLVIAAYILPHVSAGLRIPVIAYMVVISVMVHYALIIARVYTAPFQGGNLVAVAAITFYISDICVALRKFVAPDFGWHVYGLPIYFASMALFACTIQLFDDRDNMQFHPKN